MKLPIVKRLDRADLSGKGDLPGWIDPLLGMINSFLDPLVTAIQGRLTLADNLYGAKLSVNLTHNTDLKIGYVASNPRFTTKPIGCVVISTNGNKYTSFSWVLNSDKSVTLNIEFKDTTQKNVPCVFFLFGG